MKKQTMPLIEKLAALEHEAAKFGFKWETPDQIIQQIQSELAEIDVHLKDGNHSKLQDEIGDLLHAAFSLCIFCKLNAYDTLEKSIEKFERRFRSVQAIAKASGFTHLNGQSFETLMAFWDKAKQQEESI